VTDEDEAFELIRKRSLPNIFFLRLRWLPVEPVRINWFRAHWRYNGSRRRVAAISG